MTTWQCYDSEEPFEDKESVKCIFCDSEYNNLDDWKLDLDGEYKFFCPNCKKVSVEEDYEVKK